MKKYFNEEASTSTVVVNSINIFKKMKGKASKYRYRSMEKSMNSLHEDISFEKSLFKKSFKMNLKVGKRIMKKIRGTSPVENEITFLKEKDFVPLFLTKKL